MKWLMGAGVLLLLLVGGFVLVPSPVDALAWQPPAPVPMNGLLAPNEYLRKAELLAKLPKSLQPAPQEYGLAVAVDPDGKVITSLHDTQGEHLQEITSVNPRDGYLYFGSLHNDRIGRLPLQNIPGLGEQ